MIEQPPPEAFLAGYFDYDYEAPSSVEEAEVVDLGLPEFEE